MSTPLMRTTTASPRRNPTTPYERILAFAVSCAVAAVAALALLAPTSTTVAVDTDGTPVVTGQTARGKATPPTRTSAPTGQSPVSQL